jgi:hypothetical protein
MTSLHSAYRFVDGRLVKMQPPEWFTKATVGADDWPRALSKAGAIGVDDFGGDTGGDSIEVYRGPAGDYFIGFWDCSECIAEVFVDNIADYLLFRATYVAPLAKLIMDSERHYEWQEGNRKIRAAG